MIMIKYSELDTSGKRSSAGSAVGSQLREFLL